MGDTDKELCVESEEIRPNLLHRLLSKLWDNYSGNLIVICFFLLGFCNSAPAVIMLSAAHDLLSAETLNVGGANVNYKNSTLVKNLTYNKYDCNEMSTGIVLLADVLPGICIKLVAPFFAHKFKYWQRLLFVIYCCSASFLLVALTPSSMQWLIFIGIMHASLATSFGEMTFLSMSTLYPTKLSLAAWAAGTGTTGFLSTFIYAALTSLAGLSMSTTILSMLFIPVLMAASFLALPSPEYSKANFRESIELNISIIYKEKNVKSEMDMDALSPLSKLKLVRPLLRYMVPLFVVYYAEYLMNQGLFELIYFPNDKLLNSHSLQYRYLNAKCNTVVDI
jgi:battenin